MNAGLAQAVNHVPAESVVSPALRMAVTREQLRLDALDHYDVMDSPPEEAFDSITRLTRQVLGVPMATLSFLDGHREWFKSRDGVSDPQIARDGSLGDIVIAEDAPFVVHDAVEDEQHRDNPNVVGGAYARFYAGTPLRAASGHVIGVLAAMDTAPRDFGPAEAGLLADLGKMAMTVLELRLRTMVDPVTGVMSRGAFRAEAERAFSLARRHRHELSCVMVGIDHLAAMRTRYGSECGDEILKRCAETIQTTLRASDVVGCVAGSTFAVLLPCTGPEGARDAAERLRVAIGGIEMSPEECRITVAASLGLTSLDAGMRTATTLLEEAEAGLFHAGQHGGNRVVAWPRKAAPGSQMRRRVFKAGRIERGADGVSMACTARTLSGYHATLEVIDGAAVPETFTLRFPVESQRLSCRVLTREARLVEVEIV